MRGLAFVMRDPSRWTRALRAGRAGRLLGGRYGRIRHLPGPLAAWTSSRDLPRPPRQTFRDWWAERSTPPRAKGARRRLDRGATEERRGKEAHQERPGGEREDRA